MTLSITMKCKNGFFVEFKPFILNILMLNAVMLNVIMMNIAMLSAIYALCLTKPIILNVAMLYVDLIMFLFSTSLC